MRVTLENHSSLENHSEPLARLIVEIRFELAHAAVVTLPLSLGVACTVVLKFVVDVRVISLNVVVVGGGWRDRVTI